MIHVKTKQIVLTAMFTAMVMVTTFIGIDTPLGAGGYIHLGTLTMFVIALKFGPRYGAISGGLGAALFDVLSRYFTWAPGTLIIRLVAGFVVGRVALSSAGQGANKTRNLLGILAGGAVIVIGYFIFESVFLGTGFAALSSIPGNIVQIVLGLFSLYIIHQIPDLEDLEN